MWQHAKCVLLIFLFIQRFVFAQLQPIGNWQDHLPYRHAIAITSNDNLIRGATTTGLIRFDPSDNSLERTSSVNGLTGRKITTITVDSASQLLVITYENSAVDILQDEKIGTVTDITNSSIAPVKTIHHALIHPPSIYLSTEFGIVVLNAEKSQISDTYIIGSSGQQIPVYSTAVFNNYLYAATAEGLKRIALNAPHPADFANWEVITSGVPVKHVTEFERLIFLQRDSLFTFNNGAPQFLYASGLTINSVNTSKGKLLITERSSSSGKLTELNSNGTAIISIQHDHYTRTIKQAAWYSGKYWIADSLAGFSSFESGTFQPLLINAPGGAALGDIIYDKGSIHAASGNITSSRMPVGNYNGIYSFNNSTWNDINWINNTSLDSFPDVVSIAADPVTEDIWAGSFGGGLAHISNNQVQIFKQNSGLAPAINTANSYRVSGLAFDRDKNLWIANDGSAQPLVVKKTDNTWMRFTLPFALPGNALSKIIIDDNNFKWMVSPGYGLIVFDHGNNLENTGDDRYRLFRSGSGNGNLPDNNVLSLAKDRNGFIWVGTSKGLGVITCGPAVFSNNGCETILPVVQQDNFPGYLFRDEAVQAIAIDGANRKWIGTKNGIWLISAEGDKTIHHFTTQNSPLPDNEILGIAIHEQTGEVFISTAAGIVSYRSDATEPVKDGSTVFIFPNPVPPGYTGTIAIRGVPSNSVVKITEADGRLVYQVRSNGGQAVWNGKDYRGRTVAGGVYLVLVADELSKTRIAGKIVFIK